MDEAQESLYLQKNILMFFSSWYMSFSGGPIGQVIWGRHQTTEIKLYTTIDGNSAEIFWLYIYNVLIPGNIACLRREQHEKAVSLIGWNSPCYQAQVLVSFKLSVLADVVHRSYPLYSLLGKQFFFCLLELLCLLLKSFLVYHPPKIIPTLQIWTKQATWRASKVIDKRLLLKLSIISMKYMSKVSIGCLSLITGFLTLFFFLRHQ